MVCQFRIPVLAPYSNAVTCVICAALIQNTYLPLGFSHFKIEGRSLGSALILEFLLYYMTKPEYQLNVREEIYLSSTLDLF